MSVPPPASTVADDRDLGRDSQKAGGNVRYEFKSVQSLRGREGRSKAKWESEGWELVSEDHGTLRTELTFRRAQPRTLGGYLLRLVESLRQLQPKTQKALVASFALILALAILGIAFGTQTTASTDSTTATASTADPTPTNLTVDGLVDRINAGEVKPGDRFRVTGELVGSDHWGTVATGDFIVMLKTTVGSDLEVFIDQSATRQWHDGMRVEMVLKTVKATVKGDTFDGFSAQSAKPISN
jgi:hypothetical protein